jgi:ABC-type transporter Mla subunit MlaD
MGFLDKAKQAATKAVDQHGDKISKAIDQGAEMADKKTGGKHRDKIRKAQGQAKVQLDKLDGKNDDLR